MQPELSSEPELYPVLAVEGLTIEFRNGRAWSPVVQDVSFQVPAGRVVGLVGESGSGKSVTALATLGLIPARGGRVSAGKVRLSGRDLSGLSEREWATIRGRRIGMIFQDPSRSLNPTYSIGEQIAETVRRHTSLSRKQAWARAVEMLDRVHIPDAAKRAHDYPHMLSGGMAQRGMIAMALACSPEVFIADEPTTALDATVQVRILELLRSLNEEEGVAILMITHDLSVVADLCDSVVVMYAGQVVERGEIGAMFTRPRHPYTDGLLTALPRSGHELRAIPGAMPAPGVIPPGCRFHPRCIHAVAGRCDDKDHPVGLTSVDISEDTDTAVRCVRADELILGGIRTA
jgi:peptide/nickel transport system ATP-binding protein